MNTWLKEDQEFDAEVRQAANEKVQYYTQKLIDKIEEGGRESLPALIFWLKTKGGFSEKATVEHTGEIAHTQLHGIDMNQLTKVETQLTTLIKGKKRISNSEIKNGEVGKA